MTSVVSDPDLPQVATDHACSPQDGDEWRTLACALDSGCGRVAAPIEPPPKTSNTAALIELLSIAETSDQVPTHDGDLQSAASSGHSAPDWKALFPDVPS